MLELLPLLCLSHSCLIVPVTRGAARWRCCCCHRPGAATYSRLKLKNVLLISARSLTHLGVTVYLTCSHFESFSFIFFTLVFIVSSHCQLVYLSFHDFDPRNDDVMVGDSLNPASGLLEIRYGEIVLSSVKCTNYRRTCP